MALNPNAFVDGVMNGFSLHIEPPRTVTNNSILPFKLYTQWCQLMCNEQTKQTSTVLRARKEITKKLNVHLPVTSQEYPGS